MAGMETMYLEEETVAKRHPKSHSENQVPNSVIETYSWKICSSQREPILEQRKLYRNFIIL